VRALGVIAGGARRRPRAAWRSASAAPPSLFLPPHARRRPLSLYLVRFPPSRPATRPLVSPSACPSSRRSRASPKCAALLPPPALPSHPLTGRAGRVRDRRRALHPWSVRPSPRLPGRAMTVTVLRARVRAGVGLLYYGQNYLIYPAAFPPGARTGACPRRPAVCPARRSRMHRSSRYRARSVSARDARGAPARRGADAGRVWAPVRGPRAHDAGRGHAALVPARPEARPRRAGCVPRHLRLRLRRRGAPPLACSAAR
jgi:hypothetical protein